MHWVARRRYDSTRSAWPCTIVDTMSSSAPVRAIRSSSWLRTSGEVTDHVRARPRLHHLALGGRELVLRGFLRRRIHVGTAGAQPQERQRAGCGEPAGTLDGLRAHHRHTEHHVRRRELVGRHERVAVDRERVHQRRRREVVRERERHPEHAGRVRAPRARAEQPDRRLVTEPRHRGDARVRMPFRPRVAEEREELAELVGELVGGHRVVRAPQRRRGQRIGARCAPDAEVDATRMQRLEHAELLDDRERRVVGEHEPTRADADRRRRVGEMREQHRGRRARDPGHVVVLGDPVPAIPQPFDLSRELHRVAQRLRGRRPASDRREVEHRERDRQRRVRHSTIRSSTSASSAGRAMNGE